MNDNAKATVELMNYLILNHIPLVILRFIGANHVHRRSQTPLKTLH